MDGRKTNRSDRSKTNVRDFVDRHSKGQGTQIISDVQRGKQRSQLVDLTKRRERREEREREREGRDLLGTLQSESPISLIVE